MTKEEDTCVVSDGGGAHAGDCHNDNQEDKEDGKNDIGQIVSANDIIEPKEWSWGWLNNFWWNRSPPETLKTLEERFMSAIDSKNEGFYVEFPGDYFENPNMPVRIWTRRIEPSVECPEEPDVPIVMVHGLAAGTALFAINFDGLSPYSTVYAIDLPGFARSSRNKFSTKKGEEAKVEAQYVESLERWRKALNINKMNLVGHSFGGYLVTAYSIKHPDRVNHLILADPWGFNEKPSKEVLEAKYGRSAVFTTIFSILTHFNPLAALRFFGRLSLRMMKNVRGDLVAQNNRLFPNPEDNCTLDYLIHSNFHSPTGEAAFYVLMNSFAWAKNPMLNRLRELKSSLPLTAIYGRDSWMQSLSKEQFAEARGDEENKTYNDSRLVEDARHHVYARTHDFNRIVLSALRRTSKQSS